MKLGGKHKIRVHGNGPLHPQLGDVRLDVPVKGSVDLDRIKTLRQQVQGMLFSVLHAGGIENAFPVLVRPAGGSNTNEGRFHEGWMREEAKRQVSTAAAENPDVGERYTLNGMLRVPGFSPTDLFALTFPQVTGQTVESAADVMGR